MSSSNKTLVHVWTDGSCKNISYTNGGYGVVMQFTRNEIKKTHTFYGGSFDNTTSSRMEIKAVVEALKRVKPHQKISIYSDSQYVVNTINKGWLENWYKRGELSRRNNGDLWREIRTLVKKIPPDNIQFIWVRGHNGNENNELADKLARKGALSEFKLIDEGFKKPKK